ncbi:hypothetical protein PRK78_006594 [Emydomyces testavorans]|uniref:DUF4604 domain-containing protein n=1 Tax=Emydomyces testavorans TaxID=2070801 RepID=A0AAF0IKN3_9EURO|nr:hypothetical protein PRK78_006594 [Emydomyces testavorans]
MKLKPRPEKNEPAFLRRLRSQYGDGTGERHGRSNVRPVKPKDPDADDGPTYLDEESNEVISKEEYEAMLRDAAGESGLANANTQDSGDQNQGQAGDKVGQHAFESPELAPSQKVADIGGSKKKKLGRVVAEDDQVNEQQPEQKDSGPPKKKQKRKKIKLSFDEAET